MHDRRDLLRLASIPGIGPQKLRALIAHFKTPANALEAAAPELVRVPGIDKKLASIFVRHDGESFADEQLASAKRNGVRLVSIWDDDYPELLRKIYDPPAILYLKGELKERDRDSVAIVGTRAPSTYGKGVAESFARSLSAEHLTIVSGLARGIDTIAHIAALKAGGRTVAVIGSGLDVPYPPENAQLMEQIAKHGAVISEFPMGTEPDATNFPRRNRIISGMSLGTIVVESDINGGAMITASTALDQNREVFAVPGSITEKRSAGPHLLIREGRAALVQNADEVITELESFLGRTARRHKAPQPAVELTLFEQRILDLLNDEPLHIDMIAERASTSPSDALVTLLTLEFKGIVRQLPGKLFVRGT